MSFIRAGGVRIYGRLSLSYERAFKETRANRRQGKQAATVRHSLKMLVQQVL